MEITVKQRLAGAIVLIALGVIFIPMLLDGAGMREKNRLDMRLPPKPRYDFPRQIEAAPLPEPVKEETVSAGDEKPAVKTKPVKKAEQEKAKPEKTSPEKPSTSVSPVKPKTASTSAKSPALATYVIQVGSFGDSKNALALRDSLRKVGFTAYVESTQASGKEMTRVKVGPVLKREEAESLQQRLSKEMKLQGQIVRE